MKYLKHLETAQWHRARYDAVGYQKINTKSWGVGYGALYPGLYLELVMLKLKRLCHFHHAQAVLLSSSVQSVGSKS